MKRVASEIKRMFVVACSLASYEFSGSDIGWLFVELLARCMQDWGRCAATTEAAVTDQFEFCNYEELGTTGFK